MNRSDVHTSKRVAAAVGWRYVAASVGPEVEPDPEVPADVIRHGLAGHYVRPDGKRREATGFLPAVNDLHALEAVDELLATWSGVLRFSLGSVPDGRWLAYAERHDDADPARGKAGTILGQSIGKSRPLAISLAIIETVGILMKTDPDCPPGPGERPSLVVVP